MSKDFPRSVSVVDRNLAIISRISNVSFPSYSYVPRLFPHPIREPNGHSFGRQETRVILRDEILCHCDEYLSGIDLFNYGYYWESHETWEAVWHALGRTTVTARFVQGLIKLAAAGVKAREGNENGIERHAGRAAELFDLSRDLSESVTGFSVADLLETANWLRANSRLLINKSPTKVEVIMPFVLAPIYDD